jgi:hypothetical protein
MVVEVEEMVLIDGLLGFHSGILHQIERQSYKTSFKTSKSRGFF